MTERSRITANGGVNRRTREQWTDFVHTGPGTLAGRWMRSFWHPIYRSQDLAAGDSVPIRIMSQGFTLYRGEGGAAHLLDFRCLHRGLQLSTGWVEGDDLRCFFHGWKYDASGQCIEQPGEPHPFSEKICLRSYPIQEHLGLIFAYLGEGAPPEFMRFPEFEDERRGTLLVNGGSVQPCNYFNLIDNDPIHIYFVHRTFNAAQGRADIPTLECQETEYGYVSRATDSRGSWVYHCYIPNLVHGRRDGYPKGEAIQWRVPVDDEHTVSHGVTLVYLKGAEADEYVARMSRRDPIESNRRVNEIGQSILRGEQRVHNVTDNSVLFNVQDYVSQVGLGPIVDLENQHLGQEDAPAIMLRKIFTRELRALAEGRPLTTWRRPSHPLYLEGSDKSLAATPS